MKVYLLSVMGIVLVSVIIDIIIPHGTISKYIKSVFSIFVVMVLITPVFSLLNKEQNFLFSYDDYQVNAHLIDYIHSRRVQEVENCIVNELNREGFNNLDVKLNFSADNNQISYNFCTVNLKKLTISSDKQHINKYEFIQEVVKNYTNLTEEEIAFDE